MAGRLIVRDFGVIVLDEAVAGSEDVTKALGQAADAMRSGAPARIAYVMAHLTLDLDEDGVRALACHAVDILPAELRVAMVHARNPRMRAFADIAVETFSALSVPARVCASLGEAEAWLRSAVD